MTAFATLCDIIASDRLVWMTGAGISLNVVRKSDGGEVPNWKGLLTEVLKAREATVGVTSELKIDVRALLAGKPPGRQLIEAATLLERDWVDFETAIRDAVWPAARQPKQVEKNQKAIHDALLNVGPRGIVTLNYDDLHERALMRRGELGSWTQLVPGEPSSDAEMAEVLRGGLRYPFLLKAHGSITGKGPLVLSYETYRRLLGKDPAYRGFVQHLLTHHSLVIVGFGLSDPDFDLFFDTIAVQFGSPLQTHVLITRGPPGRGGGAAAARGREATLRLRYGIVTHHVSDWSEIPREINRAARTAGPALSQTLSSCTAPDIDVRRQGHAALRSLGPAGSAVAIRVLAARIAGTQETHRLSELVYSLGTVTPPTPALRTKIKETLLDLLERSQDREVVAHAIDRLDSFVEIDDLDRLERRRHELMSTPLPLDANHPDDDDRLPVYLDRLILRVRAAERTFPPRPVP